MSELGFQGEADAGALDYATPLECDVAIAGALRQILGDAAREVPIAGRN